MRNIKFRGYNKINKKMLNWNELLYTNLKNIFTMQKKDTGIILMQYIGLHDKNGKEIYEGDIVYFVSKDENAFILWDEETARYIIQFNGWCADFDNYYGKELEVIGNIYDNPDLLEKGAEE